MTPNVILRLAKNLNLDMTHDEALRLARELNTNMTHDEALRVVKNPHTSPSTLKLFWLDIKDGHFYNWNDPALVHELALNPSTPLAVLLEIMVSGAFARHGEAVCQNQIWPLVFLENPRFIHDLVKSNPRAAWALSRIAAFVDSWMGGASMDIYSSGMGGDFILYGNGVIKLHRQDDGAWLLFADDAAFISRMGKRDEAYRSYELQSARQIWQTIKNRSHLGS